ncbi:hypothetical protein LTR91_010427 [Friedmanniomyces endolithicus]|uniref:Uncharacterized protein n=1 Tax=Friedmanniomyces endolithicus TaxID=329885 RepID=A0AAN6QTI8_9PEZI|nr:hypothetical protein LTR35_001149 [Friedmanniomyces endolithicus]KAK0826769.1 hypothetical protein LTR73_006103 [Friedmanniomyces endolithicus]KAK0985845.1 hypothetical protein LTR91_010427 [Friedmanniomyces endolithicus]KAK1018707.1 hypothetical protein LTR54_001594 [Friedmanniomyces endolithicus]KAK1048748.1 hypothetical protein LTS16_004221 [Friedmanniomyces endolithicus]
MHTIERPSPASREGSGRRGAGITAAAEYDFGPLRLPEVNILARKWSKDDALLKSVLSLAEYRELTLNAEEVEASNREQDGIEDLKLLYARDTHLDNPKLAGQHVDDELKPVADLYLCKGPLNDRHIRAILIKKPAVNLSNYGTHRTKLAKHSINAQNYTTMYARRTGGHLVKMMGALVARKNATRQQQHNLVRHLFAELPLTCCKVMFHSDNNSFDFDTVWATASSCIETAKWKKFWKSLFIGMMVTSITLVNFAKNGTKAETKAAKKDLLAHWRAFKMSPGFYRLHLDTVNNVPTRSSTATGDTRFSVGHGGSHVEIVD